MKTSTAGAAKACDDSSSDDDIELTRTRARPFSMSGALASVVNNPLMPLESPVPLVTLSPTAIYTIVDALSEPVPAEEGASNGGAGVNTDDVHESAANNAQTVPAGQTAHARRKNAKFRAASIVVRTTLNLLHRGGKGDALQSSPPAAGSSTLLSTESPAPPTLLKTHMANIARDALLRPTALLARADSARSMRACLTAARRSKRRISLSDTITALQASDSSLDADAVTRAFEHARWRLEEAVWNVALSGWRPARAPRRAPGQPRPPLYWVNARTGAVLTAGPPSVVLKRERVDDLDWSSFVGMCVRADFLRRQPGDAAERERGGGRVDERTAAVLTIQRAWRLALRERAKGVAMGGDGGAAARFARAAARTAAGSAASVASPSAAGAAHDATNMSDAEPGELTARLLGASARDALASTRPRPPRFPLSPIAAAFLRGRKNVRAVARAVLVAALERGVPPGVKVINTAEADVITRGRRAQETGALEMRGQSMMVGGGGGGAPALWAAAASPRRASPKRSPMRSP